MTEPIAAVPRALAARWVAMTARVQSRFDDTGAVSTETAIVTALLGVAAVGLATAIATAIAGWEAQIPLAGG